MQIKISRIPTKQNKEKLAAEAVTPEYIYQEDTASVQHNRIDKLFKLIDSANEKVDKEYSNKQAKAKRKKRFLRRPWKNEWLA